MFGGERVDGPLAAVERDGVPALSGTQKARLNACVSRGGRVGPVPGAGGVARLPGERCIRRRCG